MFAKQATSNQNIARSMLLMQNQVRFFSVPKLAKLEMTVRTPYRTLLKNFNGFNQLYVEAQKGQISIGNRSIPRVYLLGPGQLKIAGYQDGEGSFLEKESSGKLIHTGGWLHVHP